MSGAAVLEHDKLAEIAKGSHKLDIWRERGRRLAEGQTTARQFEIGDWILEGEEKLGIRSAYKEARAIFTNSHNALKAFASVARRVRPDTRVHDLPWGHHRLVARFEQAPDFQATLLTKALEGNWSASRLREHIDKRPKALDGDGRYQKLRSFAERLYAKLPPAQRKKEIRRHARRLVRDLSKAEAHEN